MYYLDDFLELLEPFSVQFREDLDRIGDLDNDVRHLQGELKSKSDDMFKDCEKKQKFGMSKDQIHADPAIVQQIKDIKKIHNKIKGNFTSFLTLIATHLDKTAIVDYSYSFHQNRKISYRYSTFAVQALFMNLNFVFRKKRPEI